MSKAFRVKLDANGQMIFPGNLVEELKLLNSTEFSAKIIDGKLQLAPLVSKNIEAKKLSLKMALKTAQEFASEWTSDFDSIEAVKEQRR